MEQEFSQREKLIASLKSARYSDTGTNHCALGALLTMQPMPKRSLKHRLFSRLWDIRYRLASKLAGFDVTDQDW